MSRPMLALYRVRGVVLLVAAVTMVAAILLAETDDGAAGAAASRIALAAVAALLGTVALAVVGPRFLPERAPVVVTPPVRGRWLALNSPATKVPSHGVRAYGQAYAIDLVHEPADRARPAFGAGAAMRPPSDFPAYGQPVLAMVDGVVVTASDGLRDHRSRSSLLAVLYLLAEGALREFGGPRFVVGNHVVIRADDDTYALVAHLQRGSLRVRTGQRVHAGEVIAACGNSGNSSEPHVHAQLMDRASPWTGQGVPFVLRDVVIGDAAATPQPGLPADQQHVNVA